MQSIHTKEHMAPENKNMLISFVLLKVRVKAVLKESSAKAVIKKAPIAQPNAIIKAKMIKITNPNKKDFSLFLFFLVI